MALVRYGLYFIINIGDTIKYLRATGIRVWVLTGDKVETAVNIGFSSGLLDLQMDQLHLTESIIHKLEGQIADAFNTLAMNDNKKKSALVVSGDALILMFNDPDLK